MFAGLCCKLKNHGVSAFAIQQEIAHALQTAQTANLPCVQAQWNRILWENKGPTQEKVLLYLAAEAKRPNVFNAALLFSTN